MPSVVDAQARAQEFERQHEFSVRDAYTAFMELRKRPRWRQRLIPRRRLTATLEEGAHRYLDLEAARRAERRQFQAAERERGELLTEQLFEAASQEPLPPGGDAAIRRWLGDDPAER